MILSPIQTFSTLETCALSKVNRSKFLPLPLQLSDCYVLHASSKMAESRKNVVVVGGGGRWWMAVKDGGWW
jgi:hypothetical protein